MFVYSLSVHIVRVYRRTLKRAKEVKSHHHRERPREVQPAREIPCLLPWEGKRIRAITATQVISESFGRRGSPWPSLALLSLLRLGLRCLRKVGLTGRHSGASRQVSASGGLADLASRIWLVNVDACLSCAKVVCIILFDPS